MHPPTLFEIRSRLFCEYRLCCTLNGYTPVPPSSTIPNLEKHDLTYSVSNGTMKSHPSSVSSRTNASGNDVMTRSYTSKSVGVANSVCGHVQRDSVLCSIVQEELDSVNNKEEELVTMETQTDDKSSRCGMCDPNTLLLMLLSVRDDSRCVCVCVCVFLGT